MASDARLYASRSSVYERYLTYASTVMLRVERTMPMVGPTPPAPMEMPEEQSVQLSASLSTFGAPAILDAAETFIRRSNEFHARALTLRLIREQGAVVGDAVTEMEDARTATRAQLRELERVVRADLITPAGLVAGRHGWRIR